MSRQTLCLGSPMGVAAAMADDTRLLKAQASLTQRDLRLLGWLYDNGVLTTDQIAAALFPSVDFAQRRLLRLFGLGVLARFRPQKWDGGSHPYHYLLDQLGTEVVAAQRGDDPPRRDQARRRRHHLTSRANLPHLLGTNQFFIDMAAHERTHPGSRLDRWWPAATFHDRAAFFHTGDTPQLMVTPQMPRPDGHGTWTEGDQSVPFFLEFDLGTERLDVLVDKVIRYSLLAGLTSWRWPVLFWLPSARRELNLHNAITSTGRPRAIVATASADHAAAIGQSPAEAVWWLHGRDGGRLRLSQLPYRNPKHDENNENEEYDLLATSQERR